MKIIYLSVSSVQGGKLEPNWSERKLDSILFLLTGLVTGDAGQSQGESTGSVSWEVLNSCGAHTSLHQEAKTLYGTLGGATSCGAAKALCNIQTYRTQVLRTNHQVALTRSVRRFVGGGART